MTSLRGYFFEFKIPAPLGDDPSWTNTLKAFWILKYRELHETPSAAEAGVLDKCFTEIVRKLFSSGDEIGHKRLVWMGVALARSTLPTAQSYDPQDPRPALALEAVLRWLKHGEAVRLDGESLFADIGRVARPQSLDEALLVFQNLLNAVTKERAQMALIEMLDDCFTGYAIFPGGDGKRDLFNWWLTQVVPAAFALHLPPFMYTKDTPWPPPDAPTS